MTKDIQRAILRACARFIAKSIAPITKRIEAIEKAAGDYVRKGDVDSMRETLERRLESLAREPGPKGEDGKDAEPVEVSAVVRELLATEDLTPILDLIVAGAVAKHFEANPVQNGRDGKDAEPVTEDRIAEAVAKHLAANPPAKGADGKDGAAGIGLSGAMIGRDGELVVTLSNGEQKALGPVVGRDGKDGSDGLSFEDFTGEYVAERGFVLRAARGAVEREFVLPYMVHRGFWSDGKPAKAGESMTHDGALWIAKRDTKAKPCIENGEDWILAARKGRDGKDGRNGIDRTAAVQVGG